MASDMRQIFAKIFLWLFVGLSVTFCVGYVVQGNEPLLNSLFVNGRYMFIWLIEIVLAIVLSLRIHKMSGPVAILLYILYTAITGLTFSTIFIVYKITSIIFVFGITALTVLLFGLIGYFTKIDLSKIGTFLFMGVIAIIILSVLSIFIDSVALNYSLIFISLLIFIVYIAYDVQMIKRRLYSATNETSLAIYGAFQLYLDFINIFLDLLRIFGKEK